MAYNADGHRVQKVIVTGGVLGVAKVSNYLVDSNNPTGYSQVVEEKDGLGSLNRSYHIGHQRFAMTDHYNSGEISFYSFDGHGSIRGISDENGDLTEEYDFDSYGILIGFRKDLGDGLEAQDPKQICALSRNEFLFAGEQWDADMGMYYNRARYYDVENGRFNAMDDWEGRRGNNITLNKYLYGNGDPVSYIDPSGNNGLLTELGITANFLAKTAAVSFPKTFLVGKATLSVLTMATFVNDPGMFISAFSSPASAASILALEVNFAVGAIVRTGQLIRGGFNAGRVTVEAKAALQEASAALKKLDPDAFIGIRGSVTRGFKGPHKGGDPFDVANFDIDAFIVSDKLKKVPVEVQNAAKTAAEQIRKSYPGLKEEINFFVHKHRQFINSSRFNSPDNPKEIVE